MKIESSIYSPVIKIPRAIDLDMLAEQFLSTGMLAVPKKRVMDTVALFLHHIHIKHVKMVQRGKISTKGFVPYHVTFRRRLAGRNQDLYFDFLKDVRLVKTRHYKINQQSTGYRVVLPSHNKTWMPYEITDKALLTKLSKLRAESEQLMDRLWVKVAATTDVLSLPVVSVHPDVVKVLEIMRDGDLSNASDDDREAINEKYDVQLGNLEQINQGDYSEQRDRKGNRLHTRMVRMMRELRPYLLIKNEPADELDIKNSQPFFMQMVTKPHLWTPQPVDEKLHISDIDHGMILKLNEPSIYMLEVMHVVEGNRKLTTKKLRVRKVRVTVEGKETEADPQTRRGSILLLAVCVSTKDEPTGLNFLRLAANGTLYDVLWTEYSEKFFDKNGNDLLADKDTAKRTVIAELYSNHRTLKYKGHKTVLESLFPNFFLFTCLLKETGYTNLAILLQRVEAAVFLEGAVETYLEAHPDTALVTVHDSVLVPKSSTTEVKTYIENYIEQQIGSKPRCTVKESPLPVVLDKFTGLSAEDVTPAFLLS